MIYRVVHATTYTYESEVSASYGEAHLLPRDLPGQTVRSAALAIVPAPETQRERLDWFGNRTTHFSVGAGHTRLAVTATSEVEVSGRGVANQLLSAQPWEAVRDALRIGADPDLFEAGEFTLASPQVPASAAAAAFAVPSFRPGRSILDAVEHLSRRIHTEFEFKPGATAVGTPVTAVLAARAGVCQDFAHLTIAALRAMGLAARYVSGYLETDPPPGQVKLQGADVSHAWASVFVPQTGWVDIDPTNDQFVGDRYVTTAWGRDYGDVSPLRGVIFTDGDTESLKVSVDVRRVTATGSPSLPQQPTPVVGQRQMQGQQQQGPAVWMGDV